MESKYMKDTEDALLKTYNRFPVVVERGEGVYVYDTEGKKYLDFTAGIAVCSLGYSNEEYKNTLKQQIDKIMHTSNLYYNTACGEAAEVDNLRKIQTMQKVRKIRRRKLRETAKRLRRKVRSLLLFASMCVARPRAQGSMNCMKEPGSMMRLKRPGA